MAVTGLVMAGAATLVPAPAAQASPPDQPSPVCDATSCTVTYGYSGAWATFTVPSGVTSVQAQLTGAASVSDGGSTSATIAVSSGDVFDLAVGQRGTSGGGATFGGGGAAGAASGYSSGGGGSFLAKSGTLLLVAGGGGGGLYWEAGSGGGSNGGNGATYSVYMSGGSDPTGGSQTAGGTGASANGYPSGTNGSGPATASSFGTGGTGAANVPNIYYGGGGGGGGGYYGGGGGGWDGGGAGGSGFVANTSSITAASTTQPPTGYSTYDGSVSFTWSAATATTTTIGASPTSPASTDDIVELTATVSAGNDDVPTGSVTFRSGNDAIAGCSGVAVDASGQATCSTTFDAGTYALTASYGGSAAFAASTSDELTYVVEGLPTITTTDLPDAIHGTAYSHTVAVSGGTGPYAFAFAGAHPSWLSLDADTGELSGTPTSAAAAAAFTIEVTDANSRKDSAQLSVTVGKASQSVSFTFSPESAVVGGTYTVPTFGKGDGTAPLVLTGNASCIVDGLVVSFVHVGTCTVTASQAEDDNYSAAPDVAHEATVSPAGQSLTFTSNPPSQDVVGGSAVIVVTGGRSSAPVTLERASSTASEVCELGTVTTGQVDGVQRASAEVSYGRSGVCTIEAHQAGDADFDAATSTSLTITIAPKPTTTGLTLSTDSAVHGQPVTATVTIGDAVPGTVQFYDGSTELGTPVSVGNDGTATSPAAAFAVGAHAIRAEFTPTDGARFAPSDASGALAVSKAASTTAVTVQATSITAVVTVQAPSAANPSGSVDFTVAGQTVGTATLVNGVATLAHTVPTSGTGQVAATYTGTADITGSAASTARSNPTLSARVTSRKPRSRSGWYSTPVRVTFRCTSTSAPLRTACPAPVRIARNGVQSVTRTVHAEDGGVASLTVGGLKIDRKKPVVRVRGVVAGKTYAGRLPAGRCKAVDTTSGVARCSLTRTVSGATVTYTATAVDRAGNRSTSRVTARVTPVEILGANYRGAYPVVHKGRSYTLVYRGPGTPRYVNAAPVQTHPSGDGGAFVRTGRNTWSYSVRFTVSLAKYNLWHFGVKVGDKVVLTTVRVVR